MSLFQTNAASFKIGNVTIYSATTLPDNQFGKIGDVFITTVNPNIYIKNQTNQWDFLNYPIGYAGSRGFTGSKGNTGEGLDLQGTLTNINDLPVSGEAGDGYIIGSDLYVWDGAQWENVGQFVGYTGSRGVTGFTGSKGDIGFTGSQGATGFTGSLGITGFTGSQGITGFTGSKGDIGFTGSQGITGFTGSKGDIGEGLNILGTLNNTGELPVSGNVGDAYIISGDLHVWNGTTWLNVGRFTGFTGSQGVIGPQGATGFTGSQGVIGPQGTTGFTGSQGVIGPQGTTGFTGSQGVIGPQGTTGFTGSQGVIGPQGATGFTGSRGATGPQGATGFTGSRGLIGFTGQKGASSEFTTTGGVSSTLTTTLTTYLTAPTQTIYKIESLHFQNISINEETVRVYVNENGGQLVSLGYDIPIPAGSAIELNYNTTVIKNGDTIRMNASANSQISSTIAYQIDQENVWFGNGFKLISAGTEYNLFASQTASGSELVSLKVSNISQTDVTTTAYSKNGSNVIQSYYCFNLVVPANATIELFTKSKFLPNTHSVRITANTANAIDAYVSGLNIT